MMKRKRIFALMAATLMAASLTGCGGDVTNNNSDKPNGKDEAAYDWTAGADASGGDVTIRISTWRETDREYYNEVIKRFEEKYDWITVELDMNRDTGSYYSNMQADLVSGTAADVFDMHPLNRLITYAQDGLIVPQTDFDYMQNYSKMAQEITTFKGENYGYCAVYNYYGFIYNKKVFAEKGISVPTTVEELISAVNKLKSAGYGGIIYPGATWIASEGLANAVFIGCMGTEKYKELKEGIDNGTVTDVTSVAGVKEALETLQTFKKNDIFYNASEGISHDAGLSLYAQEKSAIMYTGSYVFHDYIGKMGDIDTGFFAIPTYGNPGIVYGEAGQISCINANSKNLGAARLWVEFIATPEIAQYLCSSIKMFSTIEGVTPDFKEAQMLMDSGECQLCGIIEPKNTVYWEGSWSSVLDGIIYDGKDWESQVKIFNNKLKDYDLSSLAGE